MNSNSIASLSNTRDPRLPSYRPPPPTTFSGQTINIPLEYNPVVDAKKPVRRLGTERKTKVIKQSYLLNYIYITINKNTHPQAYTAHPPDMDKIIKEMTIIHNPTSTGQKLVGEFIKGKKPPKGSINIPRRAPRPGPPRDPRPRPGPPSDPRRRPTPFPSPPSSTDGFLKATAANKSKIFSLTDSDTEVKAIKLSVLSSLVSLVKFKIHLKIQTLYDWIQIIPPNHIINTAAQIIINLMKGNLIHDYPINTSKQIVNSSL